MKVIPIRKDSNHPSLQLFRLVLGQSPSKQLTVDEIRRRVRVLNLLDEISEDAGEFQLEDLDVLTLKQALEGFPWAIASKELLQVIDDVENAKA